MTEYTHYQKAISWRLETSIDGLTFTIIYHFCMISLYFCHFSFISVFITKFNRHTIYMKIYLSSIYMECYLLYIHRVLYPIRKIDSSFKAFCVSLYRKHPKSYLLNFCEKCVVQQHCL